MDVHQSADFTTKSIRQIYKRRLFLPVIYLLFLALLWQLTPISELVFPHQVSDKVHFQELSTGRFSYISTTLTKLHFTGYTQNILGYTNGYYYYTFQDGQCILVLLAPDTCKNGQAYIEQLPVRVRVIRYFEHYDTLIQHLAEDLSWTASALRSQIPDYLLSEPGVHKLLSLLLLASYFLSGTYALIQMLLCACWMLFPSLSPACRRRRHPPEAAAK